MNSANDQENDSRSKSNWKKVAVILNGISLRKKFFYRKILPTISSIANVQVFETKSRHDAIPLATKAVEKKADLVLAAGGDGTLNHVLNGVMRSGSTTLPTLGIIPIGSGNDFARTVKASSNPSNVLSALSRNSKAIDVGRIRYTQGGQHQTYYFLNIADVGMGPAVVKRINEGDRILGSAFAYYSAIVANFFTYKSPFVKISTDQWNWEGKIRTFAVANGKSFGHGLCIAPNAQIDDGIFQTFLCGNVSVFDFIRYSGTMKNGKFIKHPEVNYQQARYAEISSPENVWLEADGELICELPVQIEMMPNAIQFLY